MSKRILQFLRILDSANQLSITNTSVIIALISTIAAPTPYSIGLFLASLASYQWKRYHQSKAAKDLNDADRDRIVRLENDLANLRSALALKR